MKKKGRKGKEREGKGRKGRKGKEREGKGRERERKGK